MVSQLFMKPEGSIPNSQELSTVSILSQTNPVDITPSHLSKIHPNIIHHLYLGLPSGLSPPGFPNCDLYAFLFSPIHATCPAHLILLDLIILISQTCMVM
jgi:hypothetical protein